jgi:hypothetical protein
MGPQKTSTAKEKSHTKISTAKEKSQAGAKKRKGVGTGTEPDTGGKRPRANPKAIGEPSTSSASTAKAIPTLPSGPSRQPVVTIEEVDDEDDVVSVADSEAESSEAELGECMM